MVDMVVHRHELRATLANLCRLLTKAPAASPPRPAQPVSEHPALPAPAEAPSDA
jgi:acetyl-CoA carboxylase carboxyl transferase subunit beta